MSLEQVGMKAQGLAVEALLHHGPPSVESLESMLFDINDQLADNGRHLESCLKDLLKMTNDLTGNVKDNFTNPIEAVDCLSQGHLLDKSSCYDPDPEAITLMLKHVITMLDEQPGCEETLLQSVLKLSSGEGLSLPSRTVDQSHSSVLSINTAVDDSEHVVEKHWNDICQRFRKYLLERLMKLPSGQPSHKINFNGSKRLEYVQSLCALNPEEETWQRYRSLRGKQVNNCLKESSVSGDNQSFLDVATGFKAASQKILIMISEDVELFSSRVFSHTTSLFKALQEVYMDRLQEEIATIVDCLQDEIVQHKKSEKTSQQHKDIPKSTSEFVRLGGLKGNLRRQHSKSLDSLYDKNGEAVFTDLQGILPGEQLKALAVIFNCFLNLEMYLNTLQHNMIWETTGNALKKSIPKGSLKSVLKSPTSAAKDDDEEFGGGMFGQYGAQGAAMLLMESSNVKVIEPQDKLSWDWRHGFKRAIQEVVKALELHIRHITDQAHHRELKAMETSRVVESVQVPADLVGGRLDYPKRVSKVLSDVINELESLLPLAQAGSDGCMTAVKAAFVDSLCLALKNICVRLGKITAEVNEKKLPISNLYTVVSTSAYIRNHLLYFDQVLGSDEISRKFQGLYRQYRDQVDTLSKQLIQYHGHLLSTALLHDAESHDLDGNKEFYEDERCSFSIQMWYFHLNSLRHDLWKTCPPKLSQSILAAVLHESLATLTQRYTRVDVSPKRTRQFKCDITTVLVVVSELLYPCCSHIGTYLDATMSTQPHCAIHNLCSTLLAAMALICAPLETVYKVYKKGFYKKRQKGEEGSACGYPSQWLSPLRPTLFPHGKISLKDLQTTNALYVQVKLLCSQPEPSWSLLLQALLMKEHALSVMLLAKAAKCTPPPPEGSESVCITMTTPSDQLYFAFTDILIQCSQMFPGALAHVFLTVVERSDTWELFDDKSILGKTHHVPPWIKAIVVSLQPFVSRVIEPAVKLLMDRHIRGPDLESLTHNMEQLPCGCNPAAKQEAPEEVKDIIGEALYSLIMQLTEDIFCVPTPLAMLLRAAQDRIQEKHMQCAHNSVAVKMIASAIRIALTDIEYIEGLVGLPLADMLTDSLKMLSECIYHVLCAPQQGKGGGAPRIASLFAKANRNWLQEQIEILTDHFSSPIFEVPDAYPLESSTEDFLENLLVNTSSHILNSPSGETSLKCVYNFLMRNSEWIEGQLDVPPLIATAQETSNQPEPQFCLNIDPLPTVSFNPLHEFKHISDCQLDHAILGEWHYDWQRVLQSDLGLTEAGFRTLLSRRYEMHEGAHLDENDRKPAQVLKKKFDLETSDLN